MRCLRGNELILFLSIVQLVFSLQAKLWKTTKKLNTHEIQKLLENPVPINDYVKQTGYPLETHEVETEDGYLLTLHRIPYRKGKKRRPGQPVLLEHGLFCASTIWMVGENALAYQLVNAGFDAWMINIRGNIYSRKHNKLDPDKDPHKFFDFSWHEVGYYDHPAAIDYIRKKTGYPKVVYIGLSMGGTTYFVQSTTRTEYNDKILAAVLFAPVAYSYKIRSKNLKMVLMSWPHLDKGKGETNVDEIWSWSDPMPRTIIRTCAHSEVFPVCKNLYFSVVGFDDELFNVPGLPEMLSYLPTGTTIKTMRHFVQTLQPDSKFRWYDYGEEKNRQKYGTPQPPEYIMSKSTAPVYIYYGENDEIVTPENVHYLAKQLPSVQLIKVPFKKFNHGDFIFGKDNVKLVFNDVIRLLLEVSKSQTKPNPKKLTNLLN